MRRRLDEFDELCVGGKYHMLTCISMRPTVFQCECGTIVKGRSLTHLNNGMRSCGCRSRAQPNPTANFWSCADVEPVECLTPEGKWFTRRWSVRCKRCSRIMEVAESSIRARDSRRYGCRGCYEDKVFGPRRERQKAYDAMKAAQ